MENNIVIKMKPIKKYILKVRVRSVKKGTLRIVTDGQYRI